MTRRHVAPELMPVRVFLFLALLACLCLLGASSPAGAQQPVSDAAEVSRDLLYHPARRIELAPDAVVFRAAQFTYRWDRAGARWEVRREKNFAPADLRRALRSYRHAATGAEFRFAAAESDDEGILEIRPMADLEGEPVARLRLWDRAQLAEVWLEKLRGEIAGLTLARLERELEVAEPEVAAVAEAGPYLWLAVRHYAGEGSLGLGTLVRFQPETRETRVFQPQQLAHSSVTHLAAAGGVLWLGTLRDGEGAVEATTGLVRFDPAGGATASYHSAAAPLSGAVVTALAADDGALWVATDDGICRITKPGDPAEQRFCWRIIPTVRSAAPLAVSNRPGGAPRGRLPAGDYEVRWANAAFFELVTPDAMEGWVASDDFQEFSRRRFDVPAYELENTYGGGAGVMRLLEKAEGDPMRGAQAYRVALEAAGAPAAEGWQRVRARAGWIPRDHLEIFLAIAPLASSHHDRMEKLCPCRELEGISGAVCGARGRGCVFWRP